MDNPRLLVARALLKVEQRGAWSNLSLDNELRQQSLDPQQSAFASALFYGVIERMLTLDACIAAHARKSPDALTPSVRVALRIAIYQLLYMDSVPDAAAVDESVKLVRALRTAKATGFVNGVLRSFLRAEKHIPIPDASPEDALSVQYSCPVDLVRLWLETYGEEATRRLLEDSMGRAPLTVRVNTLKTDEQALKELLREAGVAAQNHPQLLDCLQLSATGAVYNLEAFKDGLFHVQDVSSQLCAGALGVQPGMRVLDACAAPGGKSFTLAQLMRNEGEIIACDLHRHRLELVDARAGEMGIDIIQTRVQDMKSPVFRFGMFDRVLCDVPCSGLGVIRRKPEIKYKPLDQFADLTRTQYKILENAAQYCKTGGVVIYSTCTLNPAENGEIVARFLANNPDFMPLPLGGVLAGSHERTLLAELDADGFYIAAMGRKRGGDE